MASTAFSSLPPPSPFSSLCLPHQTLKEKGSGVQYPLLKQCQPLHSVSVNGSQPREPKPQRSFNPNIICLHYPERWEGKCQVYLQTSVSDHDPSYTYTYTRVLVTNNVARPHKWGSIMQKDCHWSASYWAHSLFSLYNSFLSLLPSILPWYLYKNWCSG